MSEELELIPHHYMPTNRKKYKIKNRNSNNRMFEPHTKSDKANILSFGNLSFNNISGILPLALIILFLLNNSSNSLISVNSYIDTKKALNLLNDLSPYLSNELRTGIYALNSYKKVVNTLDSMRNDQQQYISSNSYNGFDNLG